MQALGTDTWVKVQIRRYVPGPGQPELINPMEHEDFEVREVEFETKVFESEIVARVSRLDERDRRRASTAEVEGKLAASSWRVGENSTIAAKSEGDHKTEDSYEIVDDRLGTFETEPRQDSLDDWEELGSDADDERPQTATDASREKTGEFIVVKRKYRRFVGWEKYVLGQIEGIDLEH